MDPIVVLYATREGQTRKIAEHVAGALRGHGLRADVVDAAALTEPFDLAGYGAAVLAASVHAGRHERELVAFVKRHLRQLERMPAAFLSTSLMEAGAEDSQRSPEARAEAAAHVQQMIDQFIAETGWQPSATLPVAGALLYTKYGFVLRFIMKRISKHQGGSTDTTHDHEYTDWRALDRFVDELVQHGFGPQARATGSVER
jgi:menaquinone-dependent protoporphyrinogen oxidase